MFDEPTLRAIGDLAARLDLETAAILAIAEVESGGKAFAMVDGRPEPLIRFEGHYFDRLLSPQKRAVARKAGLASPKAGAVANPASQAARWRLLARAIEIDAVAAYSSVSWGVGQVMGSHWEWLGFGSVTELVNLCRSGGAGQVELMARFIEKSGLSDAVRAHDWRAVARGYNGPAYAKHSYHTKIAAAFARYVQAGGKPDGTTAFGRTRLLQERLTEHGFPVAVDGRQGPQTKAAVRAFQKARGLAVDGIAGTATWAALEAAVNYERDRPADRGPQPPQTSPTPAPEPEPGWFIRFTRWLFS